MPVDARESRLSIAQDEELAHSRRGPSSAHRWRKCPGSLEECEGLPDTVGEEAHQGTVFHEYAAIAVEHQIDPWGFIGSRMECEDGETREFTKEMAFKMLAGLDLITSLSSTPGARLFVESRVSLERWVGVGEFGTSDAFIIDLTLKRLVVFDWKWGAGVVVEPEWNDQAILYALGVWDTHAEAIFEEAGIAPSEIEVMIVIEQPRAPGGGGVWEVQMSTLIAEGKQVKRDAVATEAPGAPRIPGVDQCKFCTAAMLNTCRARSDALLEGIMEEIPDEEELPARLEADDVIELRERRSLSPEMRSYLLLNRKMISKWLDSLHDEAMEDLRLGGDVPFMKRVPGRASATKWIDEDKALPILQHRLGEENAYRKKILSPNMVREEVGAKLYKEQYERLAVRGESKPILVPESDPRDPLPSIDDLLDEAWDTADEPETAELL